MPRFLRLKWGPRGGGQDPKGKTLGTQALALASQVVENVALIDRAMELSCRVPIALSPVELRHLNQGRSLQRFQLDPAAHLNEMIMLARRQPALVSELLAAGAAGSWGDVLRAVLSIGPEALPALVAALRSTNLGEMLVAAECLGSVGRVAQEAAPAVLSALGRAELEGDRRQLLQTLATIGGPVDGPNEALIPQTTRSLSAGGAEAAAAFLVVRALAPQIDPRQIRALDRQQLESVLPLMGPRGWEKVDLLQLFGCVAGAIQELGPPPVGIAKDLLESALQGRFSPLVRYGLERGPAIYRRAAVERLLTESSELVRHQADLVFAANLARDLPDSDPLRQRILDRLALARDNRQEPSLRGPALTLLLPLLPKAIQIDELHRALLEPELHDQAARLLEKPAPSKSGHDARA